MTLVYADMYLLITSILLAITTIVLFVARRGLRLQLEMLIRENEVLREAKEEAQHLTIEHEALANKSREEAHKLNVKLEAALSANGAFEKSRDQIWDMYRRSGIAAGNAQSWLFRELNVALAEINKYRKEKGDPPKKAPEGLEEALDDFRSQHVENPTKEAS